MKRKILIVDDDREMVELLEFNLRQAEDEVDCAADGAEALKKARERIPNLIILDIMLPELSGFEVCRILRNDPSTESIPIVMVSAKGGEIDRVLGLELGANDYLTKPFSPRELMLRVKRIIERFDGSPKEPACLKFGDLMIDVPRHLVTWCGKPLDLTITEFKLLTVLTQRRGRVQSREQLLQDVWEYKTMIDTRTVDTHMRRLREKLGAAAKYVNTVRGIGYRFFEETT